jgi:hypothetical protein
MIKKICWLIILIFICAGANAAEVYNYALGKVPVGTFSDPAAAVDGSLSSLAASGNINDSPQFFTIDLGTNIYVGSVKINWDAGALSRDYSIRVSSDKKNWLTEFSALDASSAPLDAASGTRAQIVSARRFTIAARYLQVYIPFASAANAPQVRIAEVQVLPARDLSFKLQDVNAYAVSARRAIIVYKTSIGAVTGQVLYGRDPVKLDNLAANMESGVVNSATLSGLNPDVVYFYKVKAWDANGNMVESDAKSFRPQRTNLALGKKVTGTFIYLPPSDPLVDSKKDVLSRCVDGITSYFKGMATSGSVHGADQVVTIDLGGSYPIDSIICYWRALAYPESFSIKVSDDGKAWRAISSNNAGEGAFARSDAGDPMRVVSASANGETARYIQVFVAKDSPYYVKHANWDFVQLMEVEVYPK